MRRGMFLVDAGRVDEGWPLMEEVAATAAGGELGSFTTGAVLTNVVNMCRDLGDYRRGSEWSDAAMRWAERQQIEGLPRDLPGQPGGDPSHARPVAGGRGGSPLRLARS